MVAPSTSRPSYATPVRKLTALRLPQLAGKTFLDLGCEGGFFCGAALAAGASRVVGLSGNAGEIAQSREAFPDAEFIHAEWETFLAKREDTFDVILCASLLHNASDQENALRLMLSRLDQDGVLVLECGLVPRANGSDRLARQQPYCEKQYFSAQSMIQFLKEENAHIYLSAPSIEQAAGRVAPQHVLHIRKTRPVILVNFDNPGTGKSQLASRLSGFQNVNLDLVAMDLGAEEMAVDRFWLEHAASGRAGWAASYIFSVVPPNPKEPLYIDGFLPEEIRRLLLCKLSETGALVYSLGRDGGPIFPKEPAVIACVQKPDGVRFMARGNHGHADFLKVAGQKLIVEGWRKSSLAQLPLTMIAEDDEYRGVIVENPARPDLNGRGEGFIVEFNLPDKIRVQMREGFYPNFCVVSRSRGYHQLAHCPKIAPAQGL